MTLIKSISGIRGTIGGQTGENFTPIDIVKYTASFGTYIQKKSNTKKNIRIVLGRDARLSGPLVEQLVISTLNALGIDVIHLGLATTPTVEIIVEHMHADGGIIITASHNPKQWNALKLLNNRGEFLNAQEGLEILDIANREDFSFATIDNLGKIIPINNAIDIHIQKILNLSLVNTDAIGKAQFKIAIDCVNSVGGIVIPKLLKALGVDVIYELYCIPNGEFPHNPEPLPEHLRDIANLVKNKKADLGFVVDPDVDRLAIICENGEMFGEEYTLVAVSDYVLSHHKGNTVSNLSSSRALKDITEKHGGKHFASAVGEVNVVEQMKNVNAVIGGEGNGGVIYPPLHYGRDALVGIALFLSNLAISGGSCSQLRSNYPNYYISKNKIELTPFINLDDILMSIKTKYKNYPIIDIDGVKIEFENEWVHLRKSNTEPIIRIYAESTSPEKAEKLSQSFVSELKQLVI